MSDELKNFAEAPTPVLTFGASVPEEPELPAAADAKTEVSAEQTAAADPKTADQAAQEPK